MMLLTDFIQTLSFYFIAYHCQYTCGLYVLLNICQYTSLFINTTTPLYASRYDDLQMRAYTHTP